MSTKGFIIIKAYWQSNLSSAYKSWLKVNRRRIFETRLVLKIYRLQTLCQKKNRSAKNRKKKWRGFDKLSQSSSLPPFGGLTSLLRWMHWTNHSIPSETPSPVNPEMLHGKCFHKISFVKPIINHALLVGHEASFYSVMILTNGYLASCRFRVDLEPVWSKLVVVVKLYRMSGEPWIPSARSIRRCLGKWASPREHPYSL